jgi:hypothetical protein
MQDTERKTAERIERCTLHYHIRTLRKCGQELNIFSLLHRIRGNRDKWRENIERMKTGARNLQSFTTLQEEETGRPHKRWKWRRNNSRSLSSDKKKKKKEKGNFSLALRVNVLDSCIDTDN